MVRLLKRLEFGSTYDFTQRVSDVFEDDLSEHHVAVYGKYDFIKEVLENLIGDGYLIGMEIELENHEIDGYSQEFVLYLTEEGITVEKMWDEGDECYAGRYFGSESNVAFVHGECNSKLLKYIQSNIMFEINIFDKDEKDVKYYKIQDTQSGTTVTHVSRDKDGVPCGFTKSWTTNENGVVCSSVYSHFTNDTESLYDIAKEFGVKL